MAQDSPDRYLVTMAKAQRSGRIFLDSGATTGSRPPSPRARPVAPASTPLRRTQVKKGLDPKRYAIRTVPPLLATLTAWEDHCESERSLAEAISRQRRAPSG
ncbi:hypothetical protein [Methylocella sp.]|uniref:non-homologous end-joining DNA ligase LigD n=1 Tax=Methylocella sp. TaxID=1978226 RepID=UPI003783186A